MCLAGAPNAYLSNALHPRWVQYFWLSGHPSADRACQRAEPDPLQSKIPSRGRLSALPQPYCAVHDQKAALNVVPQLSRDAGCTKDIVLEEAVDFSILYPTLKREERPERSLVRRQQQTSKTHHHEGAGDISALTRLLRYQRVIESYRPVIRRRVLERVNSRRPDSPPGSLRQHFVNIAEDRSAMPRIPYRCIEASRTLNRDRWTSRP